MNLYIRDFPDEVHCEIKAIAAKQGKSLAESVVFAVAKFCDEYTGEPIVKLNLSNGSSEVSRETFQEDVNKYATAYGSTDVKELSVEPDDSQLPFKPTSQDKHWYDKFVSAYGKNPQSQAELTRFLVEQKVKSPPL